MALALRRFHRTTDSQTFHIMRCQDDFERYGDGPAYRTLWAPLFARQIPGKTTDPLPAAFLCGRIYPASAGACEAMRRWGTYTGGSSVARAHTHGTVVRTADPVTATEFQSRHAQDMTALME